MAPWTGPSSLSWEAKATLSASSSLNSINNPLDILSTAFPGIGGKADARARKGEGEGEGAEEKAPPRSSVSQAGGSSGAPGEHPTSEVGTDLSRPAPPNTDETPAEPGVPNGPKGPAPEIGAERSREPGAEWRPTEGGPPKKERRLN